MKTMLALYPTEVLYETALENAQLHACKIPEQSTKYGVMQTLNDKGYTSHLLPPSTQAFLQDIPGKIALDIGGCFGSVAQLALKKEPKKYVLNDIEPMHLWTAALRMSTQQDLATCNFNEKITFYPGDFPDVCTLPSASLDAILISHVLHFFSPDKLERTLTKIYDLLKPGGQVYVAAVTPYFKRYQSFIPEFEKRVQNNEKHPGYVDSLELYDVHKETSQIARKHYPKGGFMFLTPDSLGKAITHAGFMIVENAFYAMDPTDPELAPWSFDGREGVSLVGKKV